MTTASPTATDSRAALDQIAEEHFALAITEGRLEATTDPHQLLPRLEKLHEQLEHHFASEEASDGIRRDVSRSAPYMLDSLSKVFDEHRELLAEAEALRKRTRALVEGPLAEILRDVAALVRRLREHEAKETELVSDVFYTDFGESG